MAKRKSNGNHKVTVQDTREAMRRYHAEQMEKVYACAVKKVGGQLEYSSARHLSMGLVGLLVDAAYTLWDPAKQVVSAFVEDELGEEASFLEYLKDNLEDKLPGGRAEQTKKFDEMAAIIQRSEAYAQAVTDYSQKTGKTPDEVLRNKTDMLGIIKKVYGSFEAYAKRQEQGLSSFKDLAGKLDAFQAMPPGVLNMLLETKTEVDLSRLSEVGVDPALVGRVLHSYANDLVTFGKAFLAESETYGRKELRQYQALARKQ